METAVETAANEGPRVLLLGVEHPRDAAAIRSLGRRGITIDVANHWRSATWLGSRYIRNRYLIHPEYDEALSDIAAIGAGEGGLLLPTNDHYILLVAQHFERLSQYFTIMSPPWPVVEKVMARPLVYELAQSVGIGTPVYYLAQDEDELDELIPRLDFARHAYLLKARLWSFGAVSPGNDRRVVFAGPDADSLRERWTDIVARTGTFPIIEQIVPGKTDHCIGVSMVVDRDHNPVIKYAVRRLKLFPYQRGEGYPHPYELGANAYCESVHDEEALDAAERLLRAAKFFGAAVVEFKRDASDGRLKLIKIDPRVARPTSLSTALGMDVPSALYDVFAGKSARRYPTRYKEGVAWIWLAPYRRALWKNRRSSAIRTELMTLLRGLPRLKAFAYFSLRDPGPFLLRALLPLRVQNWLVRRSQAAPRIVPDGGVGRG